MRTIAQLILPFGILAFLGTCGSAYALWHTQQRSSSQHGIVIHATRGDITGVLHLTGKVGADATTDIAFERTGRVTHVAVAVGDTVKKGQLLATIDPSDAGIASAIATADRDAAVAQRDQANEAKDAQQAKYKSLKKSSTANKYDKKVQSEIVDQAEAGMRVSEALLRKSTLALRNANLQAGKTKIYTPTDGVVSKRSIEPGEVVAPGVPAIAIVGDTALAIHATVSEVERAALSIGMPVTITIGTIHPIVCTAKVAVIDPLESRAGDVASYNITFTPDIAQDKLTSGMIADITVTQETHSDTLRLPHSAVFTDGARHFVIVDDATGRHQQDVTLGLRNEHFVEILSGINQNTTIITTSTH